MRRKTSIIWKMPEEDFINLIKTSQTMSQVLRYFGMENKGSNYQTCKSRIKYLNLDTSHFLGRIESYKFHRCVTKEEFLNRLINNSSNKRSDVKRFLIKFNLIPYICSNCDNKGEWNGKKLSLQLEHKNGTSNDDRLENLEFLCPNCHSQTDTFAGKSQKKYYFCKTCGNPAKGYSENDECGKCSGIRKRKYNRPNKEELEKSISEKPMKKVAEQFGVKSDNTIRKWCQEYNIDWVKSSPFSDLNFIVKPKKIARIFPSKYLYVSFESKRNKWCVTIKENGKSKLFKRFNTELEAAQAVAKYFNSKDLILRTTNLIIESQSSKLMCPGETPGLCATLSGSNSNVVRVPC